MVIILKWAQPNLATGQRGRQNIFGFCLCCGDKIDSLSFNITLQVFASISAEFEHNFPRKSLRRFTSLFLFVAKWQEFTIRKNADQVRSHQRFFPGKKFFNIQDFRSNFCFLQSWIFPVEENFPIQNFFNSFYIIL